MKDGDERGKVWSIVLAGGDGVRTKAFIQHRFGYEKPKQYCTFVGTRSMFQHTLDRAARVTPWERVVVVAARHHHYDVWSQFEGRPAGRVLLQPRNADTAAGVFLPLTYILARDPQAIVVIYPSDHFIFPESFFLSAVDQAVQGSKELGGRPVLLATKPDGLELEYGWIRPGRRLAWTGKAAIHAVETLIEKPDEATAYETRATGGLWNTLVCAAQGQELWNLGWTCVPEIMSCFEWLKDTVDTDEEPRVLETIYDAMPRRNFSSHVLQCVPDRLAVMEMKNVLWSDWGNPGRIVSGLEQFGTRSSMVDEPLPFLYAG